MICVATTVQLAADFADVEFAGRGGEWDCKDGEE